MLYVQERNEAVTLYNFAHRERYTIADICAAFSKVGGYAATALGDSVFPLGACRLRFRSALRVGVKTDINRARVRKLSRSRRTSLRSACRRRALL